MAATLDTRPGGAAGEGRAALPPPPADRAGADPAVRALATALERYAAKYPERYAAHARRAEGGAK